jgi:hypothetical protein
MSIPYVEAWPCSSGARTALTPGSCFSCFYFLPDDTCYTTEDPNTGNTFDFLILNPDDTNCPSTQNILLWFATYNMITVVIGLYLGSTFFRSKVLRRRVAKNPQDLDWPFIGSVVIQVAATVGSCYLLAEQDSNVYMSFLVPFWFARPLATPFVLWLSYFCPDQYNISSLEVAIADGIYALVSLYAFGSLANATLGISWGYAFPDFNIQLAVIDVGWEPMIRGGSAVGLVSVICFVLFILPITIGILAEEWNHPSFYHYTFHSQFWIHSFRCLACWLIWAGLLLRNPESFCPSENGLIGVLGITIGVAIVDNLWRGLSGSRDIENEADCEYIYI